MIDKFWCVFMPHSVDVYFAAAHCCTVSQIEKCSGIMARAGGIWADRKLLETLILV